MIRIEPRLRPEKWDPVLRSKGEARRRQLGPGCF